MTLFRIIGEKLNRIGSKSEAMSEHLQKLETDYRRVSSFFDDIQVSHEKTFASVQRNIDQSSERSIGELEMKMARPMNKYSIVNPLRERRERGELNPELPSYVASKYK